MDYHKGSKEALRRTLRGVLKTEAVFVEPEPGRVIIVHESCNATDDEWKDVLKKWVPANVIAEHFEASRITGLVEENESLKKQRRVLLQQVSTLIRDGVSVKWDWAIKGASLGFVITWVAMLLCDRVFW